MMDTSGIINAIVSHAMSTGLFDAVNGHEPKSAPGAGITCSIWAQRIGTASSGQAVTSARVQFNVRLYMPFRSQPEDSIDPAMISAVDVLMDAYAGDFTLGGLVRSVDLHGAEGTPFESSAGYVTYNQQPYRIYDITLPVVVNDTWNQES